MYKLLLILPTLIAVFFAIKFLLVKSKISNKVLSFYFGLFSIVMAALFLVSSSTDNSNFLISKSVVDFFSLLFYVAIISIPPTFYFYVVSISDLKPKNQFSIKIIKHYYLPIVLLIINVFSFIYLTQSEEEEGFVVEVASNIMNYANFIALLFIFPIMNVYYIFKTIKVYRLHNKEVKAIFSYNEGVSIKWMKHYILGYILFIICIYLSQGYSDFLELYIPMVAFLSAYLLFVGYRGLHQKKIIFKDVSINAKKENETNFNNEDIKSRILDAMEKDEVFLNDKLTVYEFSKTVNSNSKYVSSILNSEFKQNFSTFVNSYRVEKAKKVLKSEVSESYTIEAISEMVGFKSKSAFNNAFKSFVGKTPSAYKKDDV
jgi:AraC-like DNA-binding protein